MAFLFTIILHFLNLPAGHSSRQRVWAPQRAYLWGNAMRESARRRLSAPFCTRTPLGSALAAAALALSFGAPPASADHVELTAIEDLGKHVFFDDRLSTPRNEQSCASCHEPAVGWTLPLS